MRLFVVPILIAFSVLNILNPFPVVFAQQSTSVERQQLEQQLADLEKQIDQHEATIAEYQKQGKTLQGEIGNLNTKINKLNLQIKAINVTLGKLDKEIVVNKGEIVDAENKLEVNKTALTKLIQRLYEDERVGLVEILLKAPRFSDFFGNIDNVHSIQDALSATVRKVANLREDLITRKEELATKRSDAAALKAAQDAQKLATDRAKKEKNALLTQTKGQESKFQAILKETKKTAAEIRKRIFQFFGGGEMSFEKAYQLAKLASQATSVRAAFILAILDKESGLGQNVGKCPYQESMHPTRDLPIFLTLIASLKDAGIAPPEPILVSCANRDGSYGGAMGPTQFIPSTWNIYKDRIAELTGHNPASPWNNGDAIMATALFLKDRHADESTYEKEKRAAAIYYCGGNWTRYVCTVYSNKVMEKAQQFQNDIDVLNS